MTNLFNNIVSSLVYFLVYVVVYYIFAKDVGSSAIVTTILFFLSLTIYDLTKYKKEID